MAETSVAIHAAEIPVIRHTDDLIIAARKLATQNCIYLIPSTIESVRGPIERTDRKMAAVLWA